MKKDMQMQITQHVFTRSGLQIHYTVILYFDQQSGLCPHHGSPRFYLHVATFSSSATHFILPQTELIQFKPVVHMIGITFSDITSSESKQITGRSRDNKCKVICTNRKRNKEKFSILISVGITGEKNKLTSNASLFYFLSLPCIAQ